MINLAALQMWWGGSEEEQVGDPPPADTQPQAASTTTAMEDPLVIKQELGDLKVGLSSLSC